MTGVLLFRGYGLGATFQGTTSLKDNRNRLWSLPRVPAACSKTSKETGEELFLGRNAGAACCASICLNLDIRGTQILMKIRPEHQARSHDLILVRRGVLKFDGSWFQPMDGWVARRAWSV